MVCTQSFPLPASQSPFPNDFSLGSDLPARLICTAHSFEEFATGRFVCACDSVLGDRVVDTESEWRSVVQTLAISECDGPPLIGASPNPGMERLGTNISSQDSGTNELRLDALPGNLRNPISALQNISYWCDQFLQSETISDIAKQLYRRTYEARLLRGKSPDAVIAACIFIACRQAHMPRTFREICEIMHVPKKLLGHCYKTLVRAFDLAPGLSTSPSGSPPSAPETLLARYCDYLDLSTRVHSVCTDIVVAARKHDVAGSRSPVSIAAGAIYYTSHLLGEVRTIQAICAVANVAESTVKLIFRLLHANQSKLVKQEWIDEGRAKLRPRLSSVGCGSTELK